MDPPRNASLCCCFVIILNKLLTNNWVTGDFKHHVALMTSLLLLHRGSLPCIRSQWVIRVRGGAQACRHAWCQNDQPHTAAILALLVEVSDLGPEPHLSSIFVIFCISYVLLIIMYLIYVSRSWHLIPYYGSAEGPCEVLKKFCIS